MALGTCSNSVVTKRIVVLANSYKNGGRCIAGKEITVKPTGAFSVGNWVRPISTANGGELKPIHYRLTTGSFARVLDIVDIPCLKRAVDPTQPENWIVDSNRRWKHVSRLDRNDLHQCAEAPTRLWHSGNWTDSVSDSVLRANPPTQSLYLIHLPGAHVLDEPEGRKRLWFKYHGLEYKLKITDPDIDTIMTKAVKVADRWRLKDVHVCLSLGGEYKGYHYKLVATVFT